MATSVLEIVGREEELAALDAFVGDALLDPAALEIEGEAGIGKSTLWLAAVERALGAERVQRLLLGPLSVGALHRLLRDRLGTAFARQTLLRIQERSGGNPFFALELARALEGETDPLRPLAVPDTLEGLVRARISTLPAATRDALALASALGSAREDVLERAGVAARVLDVAVEAHVI